MESFLERFGVAMGDLEPRGDDLGENEASTFLANSFMSSPSQVICHCFSASQGIATATARPLSGNYILGSFFFSFQRACIFKILDYRVALNMSMIFGELPVNGFGNLLI